MGNKELDKIWFDEAASFSSIDPAVWSGVDLASGEDYTSWLKLEPIGSTGMIRSEARLSRRPWHTSRKDRKFLDKVNDQLAVDKDNPRTLHPTKGYRRINPATTLASTITTMAKQGQMNLDTMELRKAFKIARTKGVAHAIS